MAIENTDKMPDGAEQTTPQAQTEAPAAPEAPDIGEQPQAETPEAKAAALAPDMGAPGEVAVSSNIIDGLFEGKREAAREAEKQASAQGKTEQEAPAEEPAPAKRRGRPPKDKQAEKPEAATPEKKKRGGRPTNGEKAVTAAAKEQAAPAEPAPPPPPRDATRPGDTETIVYIDHADLHPFKGHPFQVRDDEEMKALAASVKERGFDQPALVRPREGGGYELVAGHRRQHAAQLAGYTNLPCVIRNLTDDEAILAMTESNFTTRETILASERAQALKMQLEAIKHQGARNGELKNGDLGKRSNEIVAERNKMSIKNVQRYISLNNLVPDLMAHVDAKKMKFTVAVDLSHIKPKNQRYIAVAIEAQQSMPSGAQATRMRELDKQGLLNGDLIDGIMLEEKKEETRVILNSQELGKYFGPDKTPREMKDTILKLLDEYKEKQPPMLDKPTKSKEAEK
jgi:ParB/RepB/Spo0J family partition protein